MSRPKKWVCNLLDTIMESWQWYGRCHHIYTHVCKPQAPGDPWEISVAPPLQEISDAGPRDGEEVWTPFVFDIGTFIAAPGIQQCNMAVRSEGPDTPTPEPLLYLLYHNRPVVLRVLMQPPDNAEAIEVLDVKNNRIRHKCQSPMHEQN